MLTGPLVRARVREGRIRPAFVEPEAPRHVERAEALLEIFGGAVGRARGLIEEEVDQLIGDGVDRKLSEGLVKVLMDRADFETAAPIEPVEIRRRIFALAAARGPLAPVPTPGGRPTPPELWAELGQLLGHPPEALEAALYADHPDAQVLRRLEVGGPRWLLDRYNVALVQALLLHAAAVDVELEGVEAPRMRQLLRAVKFHQLLFTASRTAAGWALHIDGPASLFSQTSRYGIALARFFPALLLMPGPWRLQAEVRWHQSRPLLELSSADGLRSHYRDTGAWRPKEVDWFVERFTALESGWEVGLDPEPLIQGSEGVVVPDLVLRKGKKTAYLEILGFWRKGSVEKRLRLLRSHGPKNLVVAVSRRLCGDDEGELPEAVLPFAEVIPAKEVLRRIEAMG